MCTQSSEMGEIPLGTFISSHLRVIFLYKGYPVSSGSLAIAGERFSTERTLVFFNATSQLFFFCLPNKDAHPLEISNNIPRFVSTARSLRTWGGLLPRQRSRWKVPYSLYSKFTKLSSPTLGTIMSIGKERRSSQSGPQS